MYNTAYRNGWIVALLSTCSYEFYKVKFVDIDVAKFFISLLNETKADCILWSVGKLYYVNIMCSRSYLDKALLAGSGTGSYYMGWLDATVDAHVKIHMDNRSDNKTDYYLELCSTNKNMVDSFSKSLESVNVGSSTFIINRKNKKPLYKLRIRKAQDINTVSKVITLRSVSKSYKLNSILEYINK